MKMQYEGIYGSSANSAHQGHVEGMFQAKQLIGLDRVRFSVNPHNPLKDPAVFAPYEDRLDMAQFEIDASPYNDGSIVVCDFEKRLRDRGVSNETAAMLPEFEKEFPDINPVWIMGADILATIHTWGGEWNTIFENYPVVVLARAGDNDALKHSVAGKAFADRLLRNDMFSCQKGQWTWIETTNHPGSSTHVRNMAAQGKQSPYISSKTYERIVQRGLYGSPVLAQ